MKKLATLSVHGESELDPLYQSIGSAIFQTSAFAFRNFAEMRDYANGKVDRYIYSRYANPTTRAAEARLAALEDKPSAIVTASGMAATFIAVLAALQPGEQLLALETLYGGTFKLFRDLLPRLGLKVRFISAAELDQLSEHCQPETRLLWLETPTNPTNRLIDLAAVTAAAHASNLLVAVDNTFASPINQRPDQFGVDIVVHSATKYLGGHDDLTAGVIAASREFIERARPIHILIGTTLDPQAATLLMRGLKTLDVRMNRINANSAALANWLANRSEIKAVYYPFLETDSQYQLARRQMQGGSGIVTIELNGGEECAARFIDSLQMIRLVPTLGGVETLVSYPLYTSHAGLSESELARAGVSASTIRFAVGLEAIEDIIADLRQALAQINC